MKSYKENWKKLIGIGVVALAALLVLIGIGMIYHEKVKKDIVELIELKRKKTDLKALRTLKNKLLQENYTLLCKIYG